MHVSLVIPAYNAAATLPETLDSLRAQSTAEWEALVVDDGSSDGTKDIARRYAERDARIRLLMSDHAGKSAARNLGIEAARYEWLLFLDSDDWLPANALERLTAAVDETTDAVYGAWMRIASDGSAIPESFRPAPDDIFAATARFCPFAIHSCLVRRARAVAVGRFDSSLRVGEDWDFWQRLARSGARFVSIPDVVALYRMRPQSAVSDARALVAAGLSLIELGHRRDPRISEPSLEYAEGLPRTGLAVACFSYICWLAGMLLARGDDARPLLEALGHGRAPELSAAGVAHSIFRAALLPAARRPDEWVELWPEVDARLDAFLAALEARAAAPALARRVRRELEWLVLEHAVVPVPLTIGATHAIRLELTEPIPSVTTHPMVERLVCVVSVEGATLGRLALPVCDALVPADVLADAIAARFAWPLLGRFLGHAVYPTLEWRDRTGEGEAVSEPSLWRGALCLAHGKPTPDEETDAWVHQHVGWNVFLQELWSRPEWPTSRFYDPEPTDPPVIDADAATPAPTDADDAPMDPAGNVHVVEVSEPFEDVITKASELDVLLRIGGVEAVMARVPADASGRVAAQAMRAALIGAGGFELCVVAVREGLLGAPFRGPRALRSRLAAAAAGRAGRMHASEDWRAPVDRPLAPGWERALARAAETEVGLILGRRPGPAATSVSRRARLPADTADTLEYAAVIAGEPSLRRATPGGVACAPDLFLLEPVAARAAQPRPTSTDAAAVPRMNVAGFDRHHFEGVFVQRRDPWRYATAYEQRKYEHLLSLIPGRPQHALELACAEGMFTELLAPRVSRLLATDISQTAVNRAASRCVGRANVDFAQLDFMNRPLAGRFDLIICSEVLYYAAGEEALKEIARKLVDALEDNGSLLLAHSYVVVDDPSSPGLDWDVPFGAKRIGDVFAETDGLVVEAEIRTALYRVQRFRRRRDGGAVVPEVQHAEPLTPHPEVSARCLMGGGVVRRGGIPQRATYRLPILMYHHVRPEAGASSTRSQVTPQTFEEQLRYLRDADFRSVTLDEWRRAKERWQPLPGRAVLIAVDDGFRDFADHAWPLLRRYDFTAMVFVVTAHVGGSSRWDEGIGPMAPLLGWDEIRRLAAEGAQFGSHTATHPYLTGLPPAEIVQEAARSRALLQRELGTAITALAYPHGAEDEAVQHLIGACGYLYGLSGRSGPSSLADPLLALPRIDVTAAMTSQQFIASLGQ